MSERLFVGGKVGPMTYPSRKRIDSVSPQEAADMASRAERMHDLHELRLCRTILGLNRELDLLRQEIDAIKESRCAYEY